MKHKLFGQKFTLSTTIFAVAAVTALTSTAIMNQPSYAGGETFFCGTSKGIPVTKARTPRGDVPMIRWVSSNISPGLTPRQRCIQVSRRFQRNYDNGTLKTIVKGTFNGQPVICAAANSNDPCTEKTLLFTLKGGANNNNTVIRLLDTRGWAAGKIVEENGSGDTFKLDIDKYLNNATVERRE